MDLLRPTTVRRPIDGHVRVAAQRSPWGKALKRGRYRVTILATDAAGNKSKTTRLGFRVVKP